MTELIPDELDLLIIGELMLNPEMTFKQLSSRAGVDQRTIAKRIADLKKNRFFSYSIRVDWPKLGVKASAYVGSTTSLGERAVSTFLEYAKSDPRIVDAYESLGAHQYILRVLEEDLPQLRDSVLRELEPLTADLSTSLATAPLKERGEFEFLRYLREKRYPRTRSYRWADQDDSD